MKKILLLLISTFYCYLNASYLIVDNSVCKLEVFDVNNIKQKGICEKDLFDLRISFSETEVIDIDFKIDFVKNRNKSDIYEYKNNYYTEFIDDILNKNQKSNPYFNIQNVAFYIKISNGIISKDNQVLDNIKNYELIKKLVKLPLYKTISLNYDKFLYGGLLENFSIGKKEKNTYLILYPYDFDLFKKQENILESVNPFCYVEVIK